MTAQLGPDIPSVFLVIVPACNLWYSAQGLPEQPQSQKTSLCVLLIIVPALQSAEENPNPSHCGRGCAQKSEPFAVSPRLNAKVWTLPLFWKLSAKVQTLSRFWLACVHKCEPFANISEKCKPIWWFPECARLCQNPELFHQTLHRKWSTPRPTKKKHFYDNLMKAECNKNDR